MLIRNYGNFIFEITEASNLRKLRVYGCSRLGYSGTLLLIGVFFLHYGQNDPNFLQ